MNKAPVIRTFLLLITLVASVAALAQNNSPLLVEPADYPRIVELDGGTVIIHHPQLEDWQNFETLSGWIAIEVLEKGAEQAWIGSVLVEMQTEIDFDERLVVLHDAVVREQAIPNGEPSEQTRALVNNAVVRSPRSVLLDVLLRALPEDFEIPHQGVQIPELNFDPPRIVVSFKPLQLMFINGKPVTAPIEGTNLEFLVNTNWDVFHDTRQDRWYLLNNGTWQVSNFLSSGDWLTTTTLPADIRRLPQHENWAAVHQALPASVPEQDPAPVLVSMEPTELILLDGEPELETISGTAVRQVTNTQSDLFELEGQFYYLASGRWFSASDLAGTWSAVEKLPESFAKIPPEHDKGHVLVSVPGTVDARAALIEAAIPRKASISRNAGADLQVSYAGEPQFVDIDGTGLKRAVNTPYQIIQFNGYYYLCYKAVWYFAIKAEGPWSVATNIPPEIYKIPASDPAHNVTYVFVEADDDNEEHVHYHYTSGYTGTYAVNMAIVFGTGWYYNPWSYYYPWGYPAYGYYPHTYGYGAWYNPATGRYGERAVGYGPYGGIASTAVYNPATGAYVRGESVWDHDELARAGYGYNPRTNTFAAGNMYYDFDDNEGWREGYVERGDRWVYSETEIDGDRRFTEYETARGLEGSSNRVWDDGEMTGRGMIEAGNRSAQTRSQLDDQGASLGIDGSQGGSLDISKNRGEAGREISGNTAGGKEFSGESQRSSGGAVNTRLETEGGSQAAIRRQGGDVSYTGRSAEGDLYAGRNGDIYKRGSDGWQKYGNDGWSYMAQRERQYDGSRESLQADTSQLNRQYNARQSGQRNYANFQRQRGDSMQRMGGRRRR